MGVNEYIRAMVVGTDSVFCAVNAGLEERIGGQ